MIIINNIIISSSWVHVPWLPPTPTCFYRYGCWSWKKNVFNKLTKKASLVLFSFDASFSFIDTCSLSKSCHRKTHYNYEIDVIIIIIILKYTVYFIIIICCFVLIIQASMYSGLSLSIFTHMHTLLLWELSSRHARRLSKQNKMVWCIIIWQ